MWNLKNPSSLGLENLKRLRHFSWKELLASEWMEDLRGVIACNAVHLQSFAIDVVDWDAANQPSRKSRKRMLLSEDDEDPAEEESAAEETAEEETAEKPSTNNFLAWKVLRLQPRTDLVVFPTLTELSLSNISFEGAVTELVSAFNVDMLKSLKMESCEWCPEFLLALADSPKAMRLKVFHLSMSDRREELRPIETFLEAFAGLEELGFVIQPPLATPKYWNSVLNHKSTLKYFVYHERIQPHYPRHNAFVDRCPLLKKSEDDKEAVGNAFEELLAKSGLECLAICGNLDSLVSHYFTPSTPALRTSLHSKQTPSITHSRPAPKTRIHDPPKRNQAPPRPTLRRKQTTSRNRPHATQPPKPRPPKHHSALGPQPQHAAKNEPRRPPSPPSPPPLRPRLLGLQSRRSAQPASPRPRRLLPLGALRRRQLHLRAGRGYTEHFDADTLGLAGTGRGVLAVGARSEERGRGAVWRLSVRMPCGSADAVILRRRDGPGKVGSTGWRVGCVSVTVDPNPIRLSFLPNSSFHVHHIFPS